MKLIPGSVALLVALGAGACSTVRADPALTIYNGNFGVVRDNVQLNLQRGANQLSFNDITRMLEPDSVILRDPSGKRQLQILEQNYRNDPISEGRLLAYFEGKTIDFLVRRENKEEIVRGKIVRSGYTPPPSQLLGQYSNQYNQYNYGQNNQPIIEVNGQLRFGLPGTPLFPSLPNDSILKPTLNATIQSDTAGPLNAEIAYVTGGMTWKADYNLVSPEADDTIDLVGWITMDNQSGKEFANANIKLMAGDVSKIQPGNRGPQGPMAGFSYNESARPVVTEKSFDEYHLYTLQRPVSLRERETKQVEFVHADGIKSQRIYIYDGAAMQGYWTRWDYSSDYRGQPSYGTQSNKKVWVMREFKNTAANGLGIPLPKGRLRFYRRDNEGPNAAGQLEFTGENMIDHTPKDESVRVYTGDAFDVVGERKQTSYKQAGNTADESFEIKLRNHKKKPVEVRVVEHMYRWSNWEITQSSQAAMKTDSRTVEFRVALAPDEEKIVTYTVHYSW